MSEHTNSTPEGFVIPVHRSLTEKMLVAGIPREVFYPNIMALGICIVYFQFLYTIPVHFLIHIFSLHIAKSDPDFLKIFREYMPTKEYYY